MKNSLLAGLSICVLFCISGCCDEDTQTICDVNIGMHPTDLHVYMPDEVDREAYFDAGCIQCDLEERQACADAAYLQEFYTVIRYPAEARENDIQGKVIIRFVIEKDGSVSHFEVIEGIGYGCEEAVIAAIQTVVPWIPAVQNGTYVRSFRELPVIFKLG